MLNVARICTCVAACIIFARSWFTWAQQTCQPLPSFMAPVPGEKNIPQQMVGIWYKYRQKTQYGGASATINQRIQWVSIAPTVDAISGKPATAMWRQSAQYMTPENKTCQHHFWSGQYGEDGVQFGEVAVSQDDYILRQGNYVIMYHDYQKLVVGYSCYAPQLNGTCTTPVIFAQTRTKPTDLLASEKENFDSIVDGSLAPYCIKAADIPLQSYTDTLPLCPFVDPPECMGQIIHGFGITNTSQPDAPSYGAISRCKLPNVIGMAVPYDPAQAAGLWFGYRFQSIEPSTAGLQFTWHNLGVTSLPLPNNGRAYMGWFEYVFSNSSGCQRGYYVGDIGTAGQGNGHLGPISASGDRINFKPFVLYFDNSFVLYYGCLAPEPTKEHCRIPLVLAGTRKNPSGLSAAETTKFDSIITSLVGKFGCGAEDIPLVDRRSDITCPYKGADSCAQKYIQGLQEAVIPSSVPTTTSTMSYH